MSDRDAIPSGDGDVAIPAELRARLRAAADRWLTKACDIAFLPDCRDAVIDAVHLLDVIDEVKLPETLAPDVEEHLLALEALEVPGAFDRQIVAVRELLRIYRREARR
jgi:hypothetical protein